MSLFNELKRRNVFRVAVGYLVLAWLLVQVGDVMFETFAAPEWVMKVLVGFLILGFPVAMFLSWAFELTPEGIKREQEVDRSQSISQVTGRKLDFIVMGIMAVAIGYFVIDKFLLTAESGTAQVTQAAALEQSVAVLPFVNRSPAAEDAFFADGIHDDLLTQLSKIADIKVISRTSVMQYRDTTKTMKQIGAELGVSTILEGAVQRAGNNVRINAQLINAETDEHIWASTFDREWSVENLLAIQSEIAENIASSLHATLSPGAIRALRNAPTDNRQAYDYYLGGLSISRGGSVPGTLDARVEKFEQAVALDPDFTLAWIELGGAYTDLYWYQSRDFADRDRASEILLQQLKHVARGMPEYELALADHYYHGYLDYDRALEHAAIAQQGLPGNSFVYAVQAWILRRQNRWDESREMINKAMAIAPTDVVLLSDVIDILGDIHDMKGVNAAAKRLEILGTDDPWANFLPSDKFARHLGQPRLSADAAQSVGIENIAGYIGVDYLDRLFETGAFPALLEFMAASVDATTTDQFRMRPHALYRGRILKAEGREQEAKAQFMEAEQVIEKWEQANRVDERSLAARALVKMEMGMLDDALEYADQAMDVMPMSKDALHGLNQWLVRIKVLIARGELDQALQELDEFLGYPGAGSVEWFEVDARHAALLSHPGYAEVRAKYTAEAWDRKVAAKYY